MKLEFNFEAISEKLNPKRIKLNDHVPFSFLFPLHTWQKRGKNNPSCPLMDRLNVNLEIYTCSNKKEGWIRRGYWISRCTVDTQGAKTLRLTKWYQAETLSKDTPSCYIETINWYRINVFILAWVGFVKIKTTQWYRNFSHLITKKLC